MVVTEEAARIMWCPHKRSDHTDCMGSSCMMWRWRVSPEYAERLAELKKRGSYSLDIPAPNGFCGLAGRPE